ncbi:MAG: hypothetical protein H7067_03315, partial [Burkholderiales bacterium]|nr:hypothetical protein [Opitutaceae bacterium]
AAEAGSAESKAALAALDAQIVAIETALDHAPDAAEQTAAKQRLAALKERRSALRKDYAQEKFDELQADTKVEYEKATAWIKSTAGAVKETVVGPEVDAASSVQAAVNPQADVVTFQVNIYKLKPSPENKGEVKTALDALDAEIERLKDHAKSPPKGENRSALETRIKALEKREGSLQGEFTRAGWDSLVGDLKSEWDQVVK